MIKLAQGELFFGSVLDENDAYINGTIHDEIVCDAPEDAEKAYAVAKEMQRVMRLPYATMVVPFDSEVTIGVNFGDQVKLPGNFTVEDVAKAIAESKAAAAAKRAVAKVAREEAVA